MCGRHELTPPGYHALGCLDRERHAPAPVLYLAPYEYGSAGGAALPAVVHGLEHGQEHAGELGVQGEYSRIEAREHPGEGSVEYLVGHPREK